MSTLITMLVAPRRIAEQLRAAPGWMTQFVLLAVLNIILAVVVHPYLVQLTLAHLPDTATVSARIAMKQALDGELAARSAFLPFRLMIGWVSFALILFYSCKAWGRTQPLRFAQIFSLEVHAETVLLLGQVGALVMMLLRPSADAIVVPFGLDALAPGSVDPVIRILLNAINPFAAWYVFILSAGVAACCEFNRPKAALVVLSVWGLNLAFTVVGTYILRETFHLRL